MPEAVQKRLAVFLDRDGTINADPGYLSRPEQLRLLPNAAEGLALLKRAGLLLVVVSNQSGVGRGLIRQEDMPRIHARLDQLIAEAAPGVRIDRYELCFHSPDENCECRKPKPKLILDAARELAVDVSGSYLVGDKFSDLRAGQAAGCKARILVRTGYGGEEQLTCGSDADYVADDLLDAASWILRDRGQGDLPQSSSSR
jgi:histidinol-phosphate phosphatase family protein